MKRFATFAFSLVLARFVFASACCGGGFSAPALIAGDDRALLTTSYSVSQFDTHVDSRGVWTKDRLNESSTVFRLDGAHIYEDRYQFGVSAPLIYRKRRSSEDHGSRLGDVALTAGYEYLPDWDYHPWRPKGLGFLQLTLPTGQSLEESDDQMARGRGFWTLGVGTLLTKTIRAWDFNSVFEAHRSFEKRTRSSQADGEIELHPAWGSSWSLGAGWNTSRLRFGGSLAWSYEDPVRVSGVVNSDGAVQRFATATVMANYMLDDEWAGLLSYSDQTLFGDPTNTALTKTVLFSLQKRWAR